MCPPLGGGIWGEGRSPSVLASGGYAPIKFIKINVKIAYFLAFLEAEMVSSAVAIRQDNRDLKLEFRIKICY